MLCKPLTSCELRESGCLVPLASNRITINPLHPFKITATTTNYENIIVIKENVPMNWAEQETYAI